MQKNAILTTSKIIRINPCKSVASASSAFQLNKKACRAAIIACSATTSPFKQGGKPNKQSGQSFKKGGNSNKKGGRSNKKGGKPT